MKTSVSIVNILFLHAGFFLLSFVGVAAKVASGFPLSAFGFWCGYGAMLAVLAVYAVVWQCILRRVDLSVAYGSRGVVVLWSLAWAVLLFGESVTVYNIVAAGMIVVGAALLADN